MISDDEFNGICSIHNTEDNKTNYGCGYITSINEKRYIITCNHIIKSNSTTGYYGQDNNIIEIKLSILVRIQYLDLIIMNIVSENKCCLEDLIIDNNIKQFYTNDNKILISRYISNTHLYSSIHINNNINMNFGTLVSKYINGIPLFEFSIQYMDNMTSYDMSSIDIKQDIIENELKGFSGSILSADGNNIGMIMSCYSVDNNIKICCIPLIIIAKITNKAVTTGVSQLYGIHINIDRCEIEYDGKDESVYIISQRSCHYMNGKKKFYFKENDIIMGVDDNTFNSNFEIYMEELNIYVPLETYILLKLNIYNQYVIKYKIARINKNVTIRNYNISGKLYDKILNINLFETVHMKIGNYDFMELTENNIQLYDKHNIGYSINGEKIIVLVNDAKNFDTHSQLDNKNFYRLIKYENKYIYNINQLVQNIKKNCYITDGQISLIDHNNNIITI